MTLIFGGSFDPIHVGHLIVARDVLEKTGMEKLIFVPANQAPLKNAPEAGAQDRLRMVEIAISGSEGFSVDDREIRRGGISYTVDTLRELKKELKERPWIILGADSVLSLHRWREPDTITSLSRLLVVERGGLMDRLRDYFRERFPALKEGADYKLISVRRIDISASEIRQRIKKGLSIKFMVPEAVESYIMEKNLYR